MGKTFSIMNNEDLTPYLFISFRVASDHPVFVSKVRRGFRGNPHMQTPPAPTRIRFGSLAGCDRKHHAAIFGLLQQAGIQASAAVDTGGRGGILK